MRMRAEAVYQSAVPRPMPRAPQDPTHQVPTHQVPIHRSSAPLDLQNGKVDAPETKSARKASIHLAPLAALVIRQRPQFALLHAAKTIAANCDDCAANALRHFPLEALAGEKRRRSSTASTTWARLPLRHLPVVIFASRKKLAP